MLRPSLLFTLFLTLIATSAKADPSNDFWDGRWDNKPKIPVNGAVPSYYGPDDHTDADKFTFRIIQPGDIEITMRGPKGRFTYDIMVAASPNGGPACSKDRNPCQCRLQGLKPGTYYVAAYWSDQGTGPVPTQHYTVELKFTPTGKADPSALMEMKQELKQLREERAEWRELIDIAVSELKNLKKLDKEKRTKLSRQVYKTSQQALKSRYVAPNVNWSVKRNRDVLHKALGGGGYSIVYLMKPEVRDQRLAEEINRNEANIAGAKRELRERRQELNKVEDLIASYERQIQQAQRW